MKKSVTILGATGSIGQSTADVLAHHPDRFSVHAVVAQKNVADLASTAQRLNAQQAVISDPDLYADLKARLVGTKVAAHAGPQACVDVAGQGADITIAAISGFAGFKALLAAIKFGKTVAIANKEPLIAAGPFILEAARQSGATLLPIDSEHNAIFQLLDPLRAASLRKVTLTASGGPFRTWTKDQMARARIEDALAHPNWTMGRKITIDSATLMNKGLELIEAQMLFNLHPDQIDVVVHPQSLVHAFIEYKDGSILAHLGAPDMRTALTYVLGHPERLETPGQRLDVQTLRALSFEPPDLDRFPCLGLARAASKEGLPACIALNAANEVAVDAFLEGRLSFLSIAAMVEKALGGAHPSIVSLEDVFAYDQAVRRQTGSAVLSYQAA